MKKIKKLLTVPYEEYPLINYDNISHRIQVEGLGLWICSCGGSGAMLLNKYLKMQGFRTQSPAWRRLLQESPKPVQSTIPMIYMYNDPRDMFIKIARSSPTHFYRIENRLANRKSLPKTDLQTPVSLRNNALFAAIIAQFRAWTETTLQLNLLILNYANFFTPETQQVLETFLNTSLTDYPEYTPSPLYDYTRYEALFTKYAADITEINNYES